MALGLIGRKVGMTNIFDEKGASTPVTVVEVLPNYVTQIKSVLNDGYCAVQITTGTRRILRVTKPLRGHYAKASVQPGRGLWEFNLKSGEILSKHNLSIGSDITVNIFSEGQYVDVQGVTKGKGFAGVIKRHHFSRQPTSHGNSLSHRVPGSIGQRRTPGRVFAGKKMAGHLGNKKCTVQNLQVIKIEKDKNLLLIKGAIPGSINSDVVVLPAVKKAKEE